MRSYAIFFCLCAAVACAGAFTAPQPAIARKTLTLNMAKDPSRSGTKTGRMERLAEMERQGAANTDSTVFIQAAGGFVALIIVAIAAAASSGLLTQY